MTTVETVEVPTDIETLYKQRHSVRDISRQLKLPWPVVAGYCTLLRRADAIRLRKEGLPLQQIAYLLRTSPKAIGRWVGEPLPERRGVFSPRPKVSAETVVVKEAVPQKTGAKNFDEWVERRRKLIGEARLCLDTIKAQQEQLVRVINSLA